MENHTNHDSLDMYSLTLDDLFFLKTVKINSMKGKTHE
jgi:hypothetical protein